MPCMCADTACPSCGPAQGFDPKWEELIEKFGTEHGKLLDRMSVSTSEPNPDPPGGEIVSHEEPLEDESFLEALRWMFEQGQAQGHQDAAVAAWEAEGQEMEEALSRPPVWGWMEMHGEYYSGEFGTMEEAIEEARGNLGGDAEFKVGEGHFMDPADLLPDTDWFFESMTDTANDNGMPDGQDYPDVGEEGTRELKRVLEAWARKYAPSTWYLVEDVVIVNGDGPCEG